MIINEYILSIGIIQALLSNTTSESCHICGLHKQFSGEVASDFYRHRTGAPGSSSECNQTASSVAYSNS